MTNPIVSILIPCYNVEQYLPQCLDSVVNQTYQDLQIVLVDDGSEDNSLKVAQEYAARDSRIEVYYQENAGVAAARNVLLSKIKGDYILFIDSDDWLELDMVEFLIGKAISTGAEMVTCGMIRNEGDPLPTFKEEQWSQDKTIYEFLRHVSFNGSLCNKLTKISLLHNELKFHCGISYGEDALFTWALIKELHTEIVVTDKQLYHYRMNASSLSHANWTPEKKGSGSIVWKLLSEDAARCWPQYVDVAKARYAVEDMWGLYYASLSGYPYDNHIKERQVNIRINLKLIRKTGLVSTNKIVTAYALAYCYGLGKLLKYI